MRTWIIAALLATFPAVAIAGTPLPDAPHVVVQGEGLVSVAPDSATVSMVARHRSADAGEAKRVVDRAVAALLKVAPDFDVAPDDITASDLALREDEEYDDNDRRLPTAYVSS